MKNVHGSGGGKKKWEQGPGCVGEREKNDEERRQRGKLRKKNVEVGREQMGKKNGEERRRRKRKG